MVILFYYLNILCFITALTLLVVDKHKNIHTVLTMQQSTPKCKPHHLTLKEIKPSLFLGQLLMCNCGIKVTSFLSCTKVTSHLIVIFLQRIESPEVVLFSVEVEQVPILF